MLHSGFKYNFRMIVICLAFCLIIGSTCAAVFHNRATKSGAIQTPETSAYSGYTAAAYVKGNFIAVGTDGRIDRIAGDGHVDTLPVQANDSFTDIWTDGSEALICGENGTVVEYSENNLRRLTTGRKAGIFGITRLGSLIVAASECGKLLTSSDGEKWAIQQLPVKKNVISVAANDRRAMAITADSDIFISSDGINWSHENFNEKYKGYYDTYVFKKVLNFGDTFFVLGYTSDNPGIPLLMYTDTGDVWIMKTLGAINGEASETYYPISVNDMALLDDQFAAACDEGNVLTVTNCATCNKLTQLSGKKLRAGAFGDQKILMAGEGFYFDLIDSTDARQYSIKAAQAREDMQSGAVVIDVRTAQEREKTGFVPGSINIPVDEIATKLPETVTDLQTEIIFYCAKGVRAQAALETARKLGYEQVYNLGGLSDWTYDIAYDK